MDNMEQNLPIHLTPTITKNVPTMSSQTKKRKDCTKIDDVALFSKIGRQLENMQGEDQFDVQGRYIASKMRNLPQNQRIYAEKLINDILFEAEIGNLRPGCSIHIPPVNPAPNIIQYYPNYSLPQSSYMRDLQDN